MLGWNQHRLARPQGETLSLPLDTVPDEVGQSHMAFPTGPVDQRLGIIWHSGPCPPSHPVKTPTILFETSWDTRPFQHLWPTDGSQPLVLSQGDPWVAALPVTSMLF